MLKKLPPYQLIGWVCSLLVVGLVFYFYRFADGQISGFWMGLMMALSFAVLLMAALEIWNMVADYQAGYLFPMRNATFFVVCLSVVALPVLGIYGMVTGQALQPSTSLLIPVFLFMAVRNLFRVRIDGVTLEAKTGFRAPLYVPLFEVEKVEETDMGILIATTQGKEIRLIRAFFFDSIWVRLRERLSSLS